MSEPRGSWADALFRPRAIAVIGSVGEGKIGRVLVEQLLDGGFFRIGAVNPKAEGVRGIASARSVVELALALGSIDLAIVASPAQTVAAVLEDAGMAGVRASVIVTAGFAETGDRDAERALLRIAERYGMRLIGPNCAGIVNTNHRLFPTLETRPPSGEVSFVSQSGALGGAVLSWAEEQRVGFSKFVSYGNAVDVDETDLLEVLREDPETRVACLYIETVTDGRRFLDAAARLAAVKPLVVLKSGRSEVGGRAALSHTGSMAGADEVYDAALRQCGAIRVEGIEEMFDLCRAFVALPAMSGRRMAIVTNSGGPGVLTADRAEAAGLSVASPSPELRARLQSRLPDVCALENPFDLTVQGDEAMYRETLVDVLAEYDAVVAIDVNTPYLASAPIARAIVDASCAAEKPVVANFMAGRTVADALPVLDAGGVPNFATGERAAAALASLATRGSCVRRAETLLRTVVARATSDSADLPWAGQAAESEAMDWIEARGVPVINRRFCRSAEEARTARRAFGGSVAIKVVAPTILHKSDVGGVSLDLATDEAIEAAFARMREIGGDGCLGVLVSPMMVDPTEVIVGLTRDPQFGPVVAVGLGGVLTEVLCDVRLRIAPIGEDEAMAMLSELRGASILDGARGRPPRDRAALAALIARVSRLALEYPEIGELDLNPVFCYETGCEAADVRVIRAAIPHGAKE